MFATLLFCLLLVLFRGQHQTWLRTTVPLRPNLIPSEPPPRRANLSVDHSICLAAG